MVRKVPCQNGAFPAVVLFLNFNVLVPSCLPRVALATTPLLDDVGTVSYHKAPACVWPAGREKVARQ